MEKKIKKSLLKIVCILLLIVATAVSYKTTIISYGTPHTHSGGTHANGGKCSSCGQVYQTHSASSTWTKTTNTHYKKCTYSGCTSTYNWGYHSGGTHANSGKCTTCGEYYQSHGQSTTVSSYTTTATQHTPKYACKQSGCTSTYTGTAANHSGGTHANGGTCTTCSKVYQTHTETWDWNDSQHWKKCGTCTWTGTKSNHGLPSSWSYANATQHSKSCSTCSYISYGTHTGGTHDNGGYCTTCNGQYQTHSKSSTWSSTSTNHYKWCTYGPCTYKYDNAAHSGGTHANGGTCTTCSKVYQTHSETGTYGSNSTQHWRTCTFSGCTWTGTKSNHTGATHNNGGACTTCGKVYQTHSAGSTWQKDASNHWKNCTYSGCSGTYNTDAHTTDTSYSSDGTYHWKTCTVCGYITVPKAKHTGGTHDNGGKCTICNRVYQTHSLTGAYDYNTSQHWRTCTFSGCTSIGTKTNHTGATHDNGGKCTTCQYVYQTHGQSTTISSYQDNGSSGHYIYYKCKYSGCSTTYKTGPEAHSYHSYTYVNDSSATHIWNCICDYDKIENCYGATHANGGKCSRCGKVYQTHSLTGAYGTSSTQHWRTCTFSGCTSIGTKTNHSGGTHANGGKCTTCQYVYQTHSAATTWSDNENEHWHACTFSGCSGKYDTASHTGGTHANSGKCTTCGYYYQNHGQSTTIKEYTKTSTKHTPIYKCLYSACTSTYTGTAADHSGGTHDNGGKCTVCQYVYQTHSAASSWTTDTTNHWKKCTFTNCTGIYNQAAHTTPSSYSSNTTHHWKECPTCSYKVVPQAKHTGGTHENNGVCSICSVTYQTHSLTGAYGTSSTQHWRTCTYSGCTTIGTKSNHSGATHDNGGKCTTCQYVYQTHGENTNTWKTDENNHWHACKYSGCTVTYSSAAHTMTTSYQTSTTQHWKACTVCSYQKEKGSHTGGTHSNDGKCTTCQYKYQTHSAATTWSSNGNYHWHACTYSGCTSKYDNAQHTGATHANGGKCTTCERVYQAHGEASTYTTSSTQHWKKCSYSSCTWTSTKSYHSGGTHENGGKCTFCDYQYQSHFNQNIMTCDSSYHWYTCAVSDCLYQYNRADHSAVWRYDSSVHWKECSVCGYTMSSDAAHSGASHSNGGKCTTCQYVYQTHSAATGWEKDATNHWHKCTYTNCTGIYNQAAHTTDTSYSSDGTYHWKTCTVCGYITVPKAKHTGGTHDNGGKCTICSRVYQTHGEATTWTSDSSQHWHKCTLSSCTWTSTKTNHSGATHANGGKCTTCNYVYQTHSLTGPYGTSDTQHWRTCTYSGCTTIGTKSDHTYTTWTQTVYPTCSTKGKRESDCTVCGYHCVQDTAMLESAHVWGPWTYYDMSKHAHTCTLCEIVEKENHTKSTSYTADGTSGHYRKCTVCTGRTENNSAHTYGNYTSISNSQHARTCSTCSYQDKKSHNFEYIWVSITYHEGVCSDCNKVINNLTHTQSSTYTADGDNGHYRACTVCGGRTEAPIAHSGATHANGGKCTVCQYVYEIHGDSSNVAYDSTYHWTTCKKANCTTVYNKATHTPSSSYGSNSTQHWKTCTFCGYQTNKGDHVGGTHANGGTCTTCGKVYQNHSAASAWSYDGTYHWKACTFSGCTGYYNGGSHTGGTHANGGKCTTCNYVYQTHSLTGPYGTSDTQHWRTCTYSGCTTIGTKSNHTFDAWADSGSDLSKHERTCTVCQYTQYGDHTWGNWVGQNLEGIGYKHYHECSLCHYREQKNCTWNAGEVTTPATCSQAGVKTYTCTVCGQTKTEAIAKLAHTPSSWKNDDNQHWKICTVCGAYTYSKENHNWGSWTTTKAATCTEEGSEKRTCSTCSKVQTRAIEKPAHTPGPWQTSDTQHWKTCTVCGITTTAKANHNWGSWTTVQPATCTANGSDKRTCGTCNLEQTRVTTKDHTPSNWKTDSSQHWKTCTVCGNYTYAKENHSWGSWTTTKVATCSEAGSKKRSCTICSKEQTETIPKPDHTPGNWEKDDSQHWKNCSVCGATEVVAKANHSWTAWTTTVEPTYDSTGTEERHCTVCSYSQTNTLPKLVQNTVNIPTGNTYNYDGTTKSPGVASNTAYTLSGTNSAKNANTYTVTATLQTGYKWSDNSTTPKTINWYINAIPVPTFTLENASKVYDGTPLTVNAPTVAGVSGGTTPSGTITITYYTNAGCTTKTTTANSGASSTGGAPKNEGQFYARAYITAAGNYLATYSNVASVSISTHTHSFGAWTKEDNTNHVHTCTICSYAERAAHTGGNHSNSGKCTTCNGTYQTHSQSTTVSSYAKTSTQHTPKYACTYTGCTYVYTGTAADHVWGSWTKKNETQHQRTCSVCSYSATGSHSGGTATCLDKPVCSTCNSAYGSALGHDFDVDWSKDATNHWKKCSRCTATASTAAHSFGEWTITKAATCTATGNKERSCTVCSYKETGTVPIVDHTPGDWEKDSTQHWKNCTVCGAVAVVAKENHSWTSWTTTQAATCTETGSKQRSCTKCSYLDVQTIAKVAHTPGSWQTDDNQHWKTCTVCGTYTTAKANHNWGSWTVTQAATCIATGTKTRTCSVCSKVQTQTIEVTAHTPGDWEKDASQHWKICTVCGTITTAKANHTMGSWTVTQAATCTATGTKSRTCSVCSYIETQSIDKVAHTPGNWQHSATQHWKNCTVCNTVAVVAKENHNWTAWTTTTAPTYTSTGEEERHCTICSYSQTNPLPVLEPNTVSVPASNSFVYDANQKTGVGTSDGYTISGTNTATNVGDYTVTLTLKTGYKWNDNSTGTKQVTWHITRATPTITIANVSRAYNGSPLTIGTPTVTGVSGGTTPSGTITITYYKDSDCLTKTNTTNSGATSEGGAPINEGTYYARAVIGAAGNYTSATSNVATVSISSHTHNFGAWTKDNNTRHKHTCSICSLVEYENHTGATHNNGGKCTVCNGVYQTHSQASQVKAYNKTATQHTPTYACTFSGCTYVYTGSAENHSWSSWTSISETKHQRTCSVCGYSATGDHSGGTATCLDKPICTTCNTAYGSALGHDFSTAWTNDATNHWHKCTRCSAISDSAAHTGATHDNGGKCTVCSYVYQNHSKASAVSSYTKTSTKHTANHKCTFTGCTYVYSDAAENHVWEAWVTDNNTRHKRTCSVCSYVGYGNHTGGTHANNGKCTTCNEIYQNHGNSGVLSEYDITATTHTPKYPCTYSDCTYVYSGSAENHYDHNSDFYCDACNYDLRLTDQEPPIGTITLKNPLTALDGSIGSNSRNVTLLITGTDDSTITQMAIANEEDKDGPVVWEPFATEKAWVLTAGDGRKRVYLRLKDEYGNVSAAFGSQP